MPRLLGHSQEIAGKVFELAEPIIAVGRTPNNGVHLPDNSVSSRHAQLCLEGLDYTLKDLDSTNGTRVNGDKVTTSNLRRGDVIRFGNLELVYESEHEPVTVPLPQIEAGIKLEGCASRGRPAHFKSFGNEGKPKKKAAWKWPLLYALGILIALGGLGYFIYNLLTLR